MVPMIHNEVMVMVATTILTDLKVHCLQDKYDKIKTLIIRTNNNYQNSFKTRFIIVGTLYGAKIWLQYTLVMRSRGTGLT